MILAKKILKLILCLLIILSLEGCSAGGGISKQTLAASLGSAGSETKKYSKQLTVSWAAPRLADDIDYNGDPFGKFWEDKFNVRFSTIPCTVENWTEDMRVLINSGDMPDVVAWNFSYPDLHEYVHEGLLYQFPDDWKQRWPSVAKVWEASEVGPKLEEMLGGTYCLPRTLFFNHKPVEERLGSHKIIYMRKDWLKAIGAEVKDTYTISEVMEIARKFKEMDPGDVVKSFAPIINRPRSALALFMPASFVHSYYNNMSSLFYKGEDGQYHWGPADERTLEGLKLYQQAYREGLLDKEFYTLNQYDDWVDFEKGQAGLMFDDGLAYYIQLHAKHMEENGIDPDETLHVATVLSDDGKYYFPEVKNYLGAYLFPSDISKDKFERIMDMMEYSVSEEGQKFIFMGFEGSDWEKSEDGSVTSLLPKGSMLQDKYPSADYLFKDMLILSDDYDTVSATFEQKYRDLVKKHYQLKEQLSDDTSVIPIDWNVELYNSSAFRKVSSINYTDEYTQLILKSGDLAGNWRQWVKEKNPIVQPVLDELNMRFH